MHRTLRTHPGPKPFVAAAQPAKIKTRHELPCAKNIAQRGLALQPVKLRRRGVALSVQKPGHTPAQGCLLAKHLLAKHLLARRLPSMRYCGCGSLSLLREQFERQGGLALKPRTGNEGRKGLPVGYAHVHLAVHTRHARHNQRHGQGRRYLAGSGKAQHIAL